MKKILKFMSLVNVSMIGLVPFIVGCSHNNKYDFNWTYVDTNQQTHQFEPSTPQSQLPTGKLTWQEATKLYAIDVSQNKILMSDDFLYFSNRLIEMVGEGDAGSYAKAHISFIKASLNTEKYSSPRALLSFNFKIEYSCLWMEDEQQIEWTQIAQGKIRNFPFYVSYTEENGWSLQPNITITDELVADKDWAVKYSQYKFLTDSEPVQYQRTFNYKIGQASDEEQELFTMSMIDTMFQSYYLSELSYDPTPPPTLK